VSGGAPVALGSGFPLPSVSGQAAAAPTAVQSRGGEMRCRRFQLPARATEPAGARGSAEETPGSQHRRGRPRSGRRNPTASALAASRCGNTAGHTKISDAVRMPSDEALHVCQTAIGKMPSVPLAPRAVIRATAVKWPTPKRAVG
jgi:hypothetical protein